MAFEPVAFGAYWLVLPLGKGGMGQVYLATRRDRPEPLVVKKLHAGLMGSQLTVRRFRHEAEVTAAIESPHLVRIVETGMVGDEPYIAMEYLPGRTLGQLMSHLKARGRQLPPEVVVEIGVQALRGLAALHDARDPATGAPIAPIHRDLAPKNVMLGEDGVVRLIDLGVGKSALQDWRTRTGVAVGTPGYMSPEQAAGAPVDRRTDLYSMGVVLFELLTLTRYFEPGPLPAMLRAMLEPARVPVETRRPDAPAPLAAVIWRALEPAREARFASADEMLEALSAAAPSAEGAARRMAVELLRDGPDEERTQILRALTAPPAAPPPPPAERTEILFSRTAPLAPAPVAAPAVSPLSRRALTALGLGLAGALAAVVAALATLDRSPPPSPPEPSARESRARIEAVGAVAAPGALPATTPTASPAASPSAARRAPAARTATPTSSEPAVSKAPPSSDPGVDQRLDALIARAERVRPRAPEAADGIIGEASRWLRSRDEARARAALYALEARLAELERGP